MFKNTLVLIILLALSFMMSCKGAETNITTPIQDTQEVPRHLGATSLLGLWQVTIDKEAGTIEAVDMRLGNLILNALGFLEPPPFTGVNIDFDTLDINIPANTVGVDVIITHPFDDPVFMGFDVRGVVFGPEVTNGDGLTIIPSPEYFKGVPMGYRDGILGTPDALANYEGLAGYKYFCDGLGQDDDLVTFMSNPGNLLNRGVFSNGSSIRRHYDLSWAETSPPINFFVFNYAVYANFNWPTGSPPFTIDDFEITTANSAEAFCAKVEETANSLYFGGGGSGGSISLKVEVWDWQRNIADVTLESIESGVIPQTSYTTSGAGSTDKSYLYEFVDIPAVPTAVGDLDLLITVTDPVTFGEAWFAGLLPTTNPMYAECVYNCWPYTTTVSQCPPPVVISITPDNCAPDNIPTPTTINGNTFIDGPSLAVTLKKSGQTDIPATGVVFVDATQITCTITIPYGTALGFWDVVVTNGYGTPGTGYKLLNVGCPVPTVLSINPTGHNADDVEFPATITGTNFLDGASLAVALTKTGQTDINATNVVATSPTEITCKLTIPSTTLNGLWNVRVTNGCGSTSTGNNLFTIATPLIWTPKVTIGSGEGTKVRDDSTIPLVNSSYDYLTLFDVAGVNATGGTHGPIIYEWFASTSKTDQVGGDSWHAFVFDNGGSFEVSWANYKTQSPSPMWLWVRARQGSMLSTPVLCTTQMNLSKTMWAWTENFNNPPNPVRFNSSTSNGGSLWYFPNTDFHYDNVYSSFLTGNGRAWTTSPTPLTGGSSYTYEWSPTNLWAPASGCTLQPQYGTSTNMGTALASPISNAGPNQIFTHNFTPSNTNPYYLGYYAVDNGGYGTVFLLRIDNTALYRNP